MARKERETPGKSGGGQLWLRVMGAAAAVLFFLLLEWALARREPRYFITQYADATGNQAMFYTITSNRGDLIVIDGGNAGNEDYAREVIKNREDISTPGSLPTLTRIISAYLTRSGRRWRVRSILSIRSIWIIWYIVIGRRYGMALRCMTVFWI